MSQISVSKVVTAMLFFLSSSGGCWAATPDKPPVIFYNKLTQTETLTGDEHSHDTVFDPVKTMWWLSAAIVKGVAHNPIIIFDIDMPTWLFLDRATDINGVALDVHRFSRDVSEQSGDVTERIGIEFSVDYAKAHMTSGLNIKIVGSQGSHVVVVQPEAMSAFFAVYAKKTGFKFGDKPAGR